MKRTGLALLGYFTAVFLGAAILAPWLHALVQFLAEHHPAWQGLASAPFHRYVNRCLLLIAIAGLWPLGRFLNLRGITGLGWTPQPAPGRELAHGFLVGWISLGILAWLAGAHELQTSLTLPSTLKSVGKAALSAVAVALIEESLFRGMLLGGTRPAWGPKAALWFSSSVYAITHFFRRVQHEGDIKWDSGFSVLAQMTAGFVDLPSLFPAFLNLLVAGLILGRWHLKSGSLWGPAALHAGWVFWLKMYGFLTDPVSSASPRVWGSERLIDGWIALPVLLVVYIFIARRSTSHEPLTKRSAVH
ncbi:MAG: CPBP family intramembrane metalloprotease [Verrucomicrobia bacterium]|nr:CPBP family intramembrane metalloprotease [Verrucomicrobiota bacterium]